MDISDVSVHFRDKGHLQTMINIFGKKEAAKRLAWLHMGTEEEAEKLIDQFLTGEYVDDKGVKGGRFFWGDL